MWMQGQGQPVLWNLSMQGAAVLVSNAYKNSIGQLCPCSWEKRKVLRTGATLSRGLERGWSTEQEEELQAGG